MKLGVDVNDDWGFSLVVLSQTDLSEACEERVSDEQYELHSNIFEASVREVSAQLGEPAFRGEPGSAPGTADLYGDTVAVWPHHTPPLYVSLWQPDKEMPVCVFIAPMPVA